MWTPEQRARHKGAVPKARRGYPTDISDREWKLVEPLLPGKARTGRPRKTELRQVINALRYLVRSGCEWRMLPNDFPPYQTVYYWFRRLMRRFLFRTIHDLALMLDRMCEQREVVPSAGIVDSQSVKAPGARERGYDAHKKISGRKRHITVDTDGRLLAVNLTPADIADSTGAQFILDALVKRWPWVKHLFGDAAYDRPDKAPTQFLLPAFFPLSLPPASTSISQSVTLSLVSTINRSVNFPDLPYNISLIHPDYDTGSTSYRRPTCHFLTLLDDAGIGQEGHVEVLEVNTFWHLLAAGLGIASSAVVGPWLGRRCGVAILPWSLLDLTDTGCGTKISHAREFLLNMCSVR